VECIRIGVVVVKKMDKDLSNPEIARYMEKTFYDGEIRMVEAKTNSI